MSVFQSIIEAHNQQQSSPLAPFPPEYPLPNPVDYYKYNPPPPTNYQTRTFTGEVTANTFLELFNIETLEEKSLAANITATLNEGIYAYFSQSGAIAYVHITRYEPKFINMSERTEYDVVALNTPPDPDTADEFCAFEDENTTFVARI